MIVSQKYHLNRQKMIVFLDGLANLSKDNTRSIYIPAGQSTQFITSLLEKYFSHETSDELATLAAKSLTGAIVLWTQSKKYLIYPPFPIVQIQEDSTLNTIPLVAALKKDYHIAMVLIRAGSYAVGICHGEKLMRSKVGTGNIHSKQRQGGRSAKRFEHRRDKQIEYFLTRICEHSREIIMQQGEIIDYIVYGGSREIIQAYHEQCSIFWNLEKRELPPLLDIHNPNQAVLEESAPRIWSSTIIEWQEE